MKRSMIFFLTVVLTATVSVFARTETPVTVNVNRLSSRAVVLSVDGPLDNNVIALKSQKGLVVIDTHISPSISLLIREKIEEVFGCSDVHYVIYTHNHGDHTWGSQVFSEAAFIAHENCLGEMAGIQEEVLGDIERTQSYIEFLETQMKEMENSSEGYSEKKNTAAFYKTILEGWSTDFSPLLPTITFSEILRLDLGDMHLDLIHFPQAHSKSDILIFCPEEDILLTGDLFVPGMNPSFLKTETVSMIPVWISALEQTIADKKIPSFVIPGHSDFLEQRDLEMISRYFKNQLSATKGKNSAFTVFKNILTESGASAALDKLQEMALSEEYFLLENDLSSQGYFWLYREKKTAEAIAIFKIMTENFPDSWNAWDCLGEGYMTNEDIDQAIICYQKSIALNPDNTNARAVLKRLSEKKD